MGKRGFNWRARQVVDTAIDNSKSNIIKLDIAADEYGGYDQCNSLVIPSDKRKTKIKGKHVTITRILTKSQRKKLEKIVDKKKKKENRASLLEALASVQASPDELSQLTSISAVQTIGLKKFKENPNLRLLKNTNQPEQQEDSVSSVAGSRKRKRLLLLQEGSKTKLVKNDPNIVGFESESESESVTDEHIKPDESDTDDVKEVDETNYQSITDPVSLENVELIPDQRTENSKQENVKPFDNVKVESHQQEKKQVDREPRKPAVYVDLNRDVEIQAARLKLPILAEEQVVMECINENAIIIIAGETGSGKTTQVPQFLYEAGYAKEKMIAVTEPRRVAAISMSQRVAKEMNLSKDIVSYLIRFEGNTTEKTKIKFMTDGVLLKEIQNDFTLSKYSVIILDEAHERSVYTDILIGLLSRIVPLRNKKNNPLKLIVMSATLRIEDFTKNTRLFKKSPPVITVESRQFPVTIHFNKRTSDDYMTEAFNKAVKIHSKLPEGGILIFLTGQQEVNTLVKKLRKAFPYKNIHSTTVKKSSEITNSKEILSDGDDSDMELNMERAIKNARRARKRKSSIALPEIDLDNYKLPGDDAEADLQENAESEIESDSDDDLNLKGLSNTQPLWVLPLYSLLPSHKQAKVFEPPPEGTRLCIICTNVAETSLTIPNVKYVIDTGRQKTRLYDKVTGVSAFLVTYSSKAAANQRAGRAGRTGPGHCYRLYSSAVYNDQFEDFTMPEIQRKPVDDLMLQMKCMGIDKVVNFPFPSAPDPIQLKCAEHRLTLLGCLETPFRMIEFNKGEGDFTSKVTPLGSAIAAFPVAPRFGKMLALSHQHDLLPYSVSMVAALSVQEVLMEVSLDNEASKRSKWALTRRSWAGFGNSLYLGDPMVLLKAVGAAEFAGIGGNLMFFCEENGLRPKAIAEIRKLRKQLTNDINLNLPELNLCVDPKMAPPSDVQSKLLRQILLSGLGDQVARKIPESEIKENEDKRKYKYAYRCPELEEPVFMHSCSVLRKKQPEWVVYQEIYETKSGESTKLFIRGITAIEPEWLPVYVPRLCNLGEPLSDPPPRYSEQTGKIYCHVSGTFGRAGWDLPIVEIEFPATLDCYRWFAKFFLDGEICTRLMKYKKSLLSTASTMVKSWAKLQPRTDVILKAFMTRDVHTKEGLLRAWREDSQYLLDAYLKWLPESAHNEVALIWPPT